MRPTRMLVILCESRQLIDLFIRKKKHKLMGWTLFHRPRRFALANSPCKIGEAVNIDEKSNVLTRLSEKTAGSRRIPGANTCVSRTMCVVKLKTMLICTATSYGAWLTSKRRAILIALHMFPLMDNVGRMRGCVCGYLCYELRCMCTHILRSMHADYVSTPVWTTLPLYLLMTEIRSLDFSGVHTLQHIAEPVIRHIDAGSV